MKRTLWIWIITVVVIGAGVLGFAYRAKAPTSTSNAGANTTQSTAVSYQGEDGKNALELLKNHDTVETTTDPNLGEYVTSINGTKSGTGGKYWVYYVNGQAASLGAGQYTTKSSDSIEWKLE